MKKTKSTKRALLSAILALVMTVTMLVGTTFAWFTDSVTSSGNKIVAGNLDVKLHMYIGDKYVDISDSTLPIFGEGGLIDTYEDVSTLWEPGKTQVVYLAIENAGSLALKYKVSLNVTDIQENLNEVLYYTITPDVDATEGKLTAWDGANALQVAAGEQIVSGTEDESFVSMTPGAWHYFALSVHMDEQAGNQYMKGEITFDMSILATQVEYEADSFGTEYDGGLGDYTVTFNGVEIPGVVKENADGSKLFYADDASMVRLMAIPENVGESYEVPYGVTDLGRVLAYETGIEKLTIPATVNYAQKALENSSFEEIILEDGLTTIPNRLFYKTDVASIEIPSSVTTIEESAFAQAKIENLTVPATVENIGNQAFSYMPELVSVTIESGATIPYYAFRACPKLKVVVIEGEVDIYNAGTTISNTEAGGRHDMQFYVTSESMAQKVKDICGAQRPDANYANKNTYTVTVVEKVSDGFYKESGKDTTFFASSAEGIASFSDWRNSTTPVEGSGLYSAWMTLLCDVDMSGVEYTPFMCYFTSFDGNGHTISNLDAGQGMSGKSGFVSYAGGGRIMNLTLENVTVEGCQAGLFVGGSEGLKIENCFVAGDNKVIWSENETSDYVEEWSAVGAIAGYNVQGNFDVTILPGAKIAVYEMGMVTNATRVNNYIGAGADNSRAGGIKNNGTVGIVATSNVVDNDQAGFDSAVASSSIVEVNLGKGNYTLPQTNGKDVSIVGTKDTVIDVTAGHYADNGSLYLKGVTIKGGVGMSGPDYAAIYSPDAVFVDCYFDGGFRVGRDGATFIGCTFDLTTTSSTSREYVWTYGNDVIFDNCTFNTSGKAILVYKDGGNEVSKVTVKNCVFNADQGYKAGAIANQNCAAIEIDNRGCGVELTLQGNTVNSNFSGEWRIKDVNSNATMTVNGVTYETLTLDGKKMVRDASKNVSFVD